MEIAERPPTLEAVPIRLRTPLLLLLAAPLFLVLAACGSSQAASTTDSGSDHSTTAEKGGVKLTISPSSGPVGTAVDVKLTGVATNTGYGVVSFKDSTGAFGEDELTTDYVVDTRTAGEGGSLHLVYKIPANVLVIASPGAQNPTRKTPTTAGLGAVVFAAGDVELEIPFTIVGGPSGRASTGVKELDTLIAALVSRDEAALAPLVGLTTAPCTASSMEAASGQPLCGSDVADGSDVLFLPETVTGVCRTAVRQRAIQTPELSELAHSLVPDSATSLYAVYRSSGTASYTVVFTRASGDAGYGVLATLLTVDGGKLTAIRRHCGEVAKEKETFAELSAGVQPEDFLLDPTKP